MAGPGFHHFSLGNSALGFIGIVYVGPRAVSIRGLGLSKAGAMISAATLNAGGREPRGVMRIAYKYLRPPSLQKRNSSLHHSMQST